ncbi:glucose-6-phosphate isomerase [Akkermansiaceae bacterium]|nr:glucose-6-phosphate isomerase [Akkermansiaceae bacterium]
MSNWQKYLTSTTRYAQLGFSIDTSLMDMPESYISSHQSSIDKAFAHLADLEAGAIVNPDEGRMVGHYWLRNPELAPNEEIKAQITEPIEQLKSFTKDVHNGVITAPNGAKFDTLLIIGIGGSALGPQLVYDALGENAKLTTYFLDNTDPKGMDSVIAKIGIKLATTISLVISKSGGTAETRNGMLEVQNAYEQQDLKFGAHAVAITGEGSKLHKVATEKGFIQIFPMEDWVGGRTSLMSTVGLVPAALQGVDIDAFLEGAAKMDALTRVADYSENAAMQLALAWHFAGNGKGEKDMVVLPYKDSLVLFSKYLQQLVMESLGKEYDLDGNVVNQGIAVYGNKGSTDQHAYIQQLRDGVNNFFATFIEVRKGRDGESIEVEPNNTSADFLQGFLRGTRKALHQSGRKSITISIHEVNEETLGSLIALFERAVTFYASIVNVNAYHQPGVEAGKAAAVEFLELLNQVRGSLTGWEKSAQDIAEAISADPEEVYHALTHLSANNEVLKNEAETPDKDTFKL